jgi:hypothetical protein
MALAWARVAALTVVVSGAGGCAFSKEALVTVRNDTSAPLTVQPQLIGNSGFEPPIRVEPQSERAMVQYQESRFGSEPAAKVLLRLRLASTPACVATLDSSAVTRAAQRSPTHRRWTISITEDLLKASGCPAFGRAPARPAPAP